MREVGADVDLIQKVENMVARCEKSQGNDAPKQKEPDHDDR